MYLSESINRILEITPTAYAAYEIVKNSDEEITDYKVLDYNLSYINLISENAIVADEIKIKNFIFNIKNDIPKVDKAILSGFKGRITGYTPTYRKWLNIYVFHENDNKLIIQITDITKEKTLEKHLKNKSKELELVTNVIEDLILVVDLNGKINRVNEAWERTLGYTRSELLDNDIASFIDTSSYYTIVNNFIEQSIFKRNNIIRTQMKKKVGGYGIIEWNCSLFEPYVYAVGRDITDLIETQERILHLSYHDKLTGLYNRSFFEEELKRLDNSRHMPLSIIMGDVNGLKIANDAFGHSKGDQLLKDIANILKSSIREGDILARWGGDEFTILLPNTDEESTKEIISRISISCKEKVSILNHASISLGYSIKNSPNESIYNALANAEINMYKNKSKDGKAFRKNIITSMVKYLKDENHKIDSNISKTKLYLKRISSLLKLNEHDLDKLLLLADVHDIGLISVPKSILNKKDPLTEFDWNEIKRHSETGFRIAKSIPEISHIANGILYHHERYDGKGYPHGLKGNEIPFINRIFSVVNIYEALSQNKVYRNSFTREEILNCLKINKGIIFDPEIIDLFLDILNEEDVSYLTN